MVNLKAEAESASTPSADPDAGTKTDRQRLRQRLLADRQQFALGPQGLAAHAALAGHLIDVLEALEPECLGLYWPTRGEFNAPPTLLADPRFTALIGPSQLALPFARRTPPSLEFRRWDGRAPTAVDDCGIASAEGATVVPDVVLVPCVGHSAEGFRLGYGGGYFDRWLAAHPHVTAIGVGWSSGLMSAAEFIAEPHDVALAMVVTEAGVVG